MYHTNKTFSCNTLRFLFWFSVCLGIGFNFFLQGFLLTKLELENENKCNASPSHIIINKDDKGCWLPSQYKRVVLFIIDALRYDFLDPTNTNKSYSNQFTSISRLLKEKPNHSLLFKFVADPPTTTSQRLKALTTGSLPTFIDGGQNFNSDLIQADNIIWQWANMKKRIVAFGDGTWKDLFDQSNFVRYRLFPSFNMMDLHTVDDGILRYLIPEISFKGDKLHEVYSQYYSIDQQFGNEKDFKKWDILIAHFLGVDHAGHKYGVYHEKMNEKLSQMNDVIENVIRLLSNDTLLLVFGDHGMTDEGDHGGGSDIEVDAALFVYSPEKEFGEFKQYEIVIPQIDLVPTLSLLTGIPIPFGNLGKVIPQMMYGMNFTQMRNAHFGNSESLLQYCIALHINSLQIKQYLDAYAERDNTFKAIVSELDKILQPVNEEFEEVYDQYISQLKVEQIDKKLLHISKQYETYLEHVSRKTRDQWAKFDLNLMYLGIGLITLTTLTLIVHVFREISNLEEYFFRIVAVCIALGILSYMFAQQYFEVMMVFGVLFSLAAYWRLFLWNETFTVPDINIQAFTTIVCWLLYIGGMFTNSYIVKEDTIVLFILATTGATLARVIFQTKATIYKAFWRIAMVFAYFICIRLSTLTIRYRKHGTHVVSGRHEFTFNSAKILSGFCVQVILLFLYHFFGENRVVWRGLKRIMLGYFVTTLGCIFWYWCGLEYGVLEDSQLKILLPRVVYFLWMIMALLILIWSRTKLTYSRKGISTCFSLLFSISYIPLMLLKGPEYASTFTIMIIQVLCFVKIHEESDKPSTMSAVFGWSFIAMQYFFATGQQNEFSTIQWKSGFVGLSEMELISSGILVSINTFSTKILFSLSMPWIVATSTKNEQLGCTLGNQFIWYLIVQVLPTLATVANVTIQRRHLMVWAIFVPKFCFDALSLAVYAVVSIITCCIVCMIQSNNKAN